MKRQVSPQFKRALEAEVKRLMDSSGFNKLKVVSDALDRQSKMFNVKHFGQVNQHFVAETAKQQGASNSVALALGNEIGQDIKQWRGIVDQIARNRAKGKDVSALQEQARGIEKKWRFSPR
jgi:hypothetical protein